MELEIHRLPQHGEQIGALLLAFADIQREVLREQWGHDDFWEPAEAIQPLLADDPWMHRPRWVALPAGTDPANFHPQDGLGMAAAILPRQDNTHLALVDLAVRPRYRRQGVGSALAAALLEHARAHGRDTISLWVPSRVIPQAHPAALAPRTGAGLIDAATPAAAMLRRLGFDLEQADRVSTLTIPPAGPARAAWLEGVRGLRDAAAAAAGPDYQVVTWWGPTPPEYRAGMALLHARMSVDAPSGELDFQEQVWDADRVAHLDQRVASTGRDRLLSVVLHAPSGALVAYTELQWASVRRAGVEQEDTLVRGDHRGHRLGMLLKAANLLELLRVNPDAARVHTWNAGENEHMLAINRTLGFEFTGAEGAWQKRL